MFELNNNNTSLIELGSEISSITGVVVNAGLDSSGNDRTFSAGNDSGYVLEVTCPTATQVTADSIIAALKQRGFSYRAYFAHQAIIDPTCEVGDNIKYGTNKSFIWARKTLFTDLMYSDLSAKTEEEVDHEFKFVPRTTREFLRESAYTRARLSINADSISAEVIRASNAEGVLSSRLDIQADSISAEVIRASNAEGVLSSRLDIQADSISAKVAATGGNNASFGWTLTASGHEWYSGNSLVMRVNSSGLEVSGKVTATSGYIGTPSQGFAIGSNSIKNGMTSLSDTTNSGVYIGTDGIALGAGAFKVTSAGAVTASSVSITGGEIKGTTEMTSGKVGGATVGSNSFGGISIPSSGGSAGKLIIPAGHFAEKSIAALDINDKSITTRTIDDKAVKGGQIGDKAIVYEKIGDGAVDTDKVTQGINTNLYHAANYGTATSAAYATGPTYFNAGRLYATRLYATTYLYAAAFQFGETSLSLITKTISGVTINYLGYK